MARADMDSTGFIRNGLARRASRHLLRAALPRSLAAGVGFLGFASVVALTMWNLWNVISNYPEWLVFMTSAMGVTGAIGWTLVSGALRLKRLRHDLGLRVQALKLLYAQGRIGQHALETLTGEVRRLESGANIGWQAWQWGALLARLGLLLAPTVVFVVVVHFTPLLQNDYMPVMQTFGILEAAVAAAGVLIGIPLRTAGRREFRNNLESLETKERMVLDQANRGTLPQRGNRLHALPSR